MFKKLAEKLKELAGNRVPVNPSQFDDPVAEKTEWNPKKGGGANFCTHRLAETGAMCVEFQPTVMARIFYGLFFVLGLGMLAVVSYTRLQRWDAPLDVDFILPAVFGVVFTFVGVALLYYGGRKIVFDKRRGYFWKGRKAPDLYRPGGKSESAAALDDIHAIQIVSEFCSGSKGSSYYSYELNLVLNDAGRINVVDHGSIKKLREDADRLAQFLDRPVWDATKR
jgi:hypothetical protein